jgi:hypothetical protein
MNMKQHILTALQEEFDRWEELLARLSPQQLSAPLLPSPWTIQNVVAHVMTWQKRSIARCEAALHHRAPDYPAWPVDVDPEAPGATDLINPWIYASNRDRPWAEIHQEWRQGFQRFLQTADGISERDLLDSDAYPWLHGYPIAMVLLGSYDHHQEHLESLQTWLHEHTAG